MAPPTPTEEDRRPAFGRAFSRATRIAAVRQQHDAGDRSAAISVAQGGKRACHIAPSSRRRQHAAPKRRHTVAKTKNLDGKPRSERRQQAVDENRARLRDAPGAAGSVLDPHAARCVDQDGDNRVTRVEVGAPGHGAQQKHDEREESDKPEGDERSSADGSEGAAVVGEPSNQAGSGNDEGNRPPWQRVREGHAGLLLLGQGFVVASDESTVVVRYAVAAARAQAILQALASGLGNH